MHVVSEITELASGGAGVAVLEIRGERRAVFVRGAAMGDRVSLEVDVSRRPARGRILEILTPSPDRQAPACAFVDRCGGCDWLHISSDAQARHHGEIVRRALPEAWQTFAITSHRAPAPLGYRSRARLHARASGGRAIVGMNEAESHEPAEVDACVVLHPSLEDARRRLGPLLEGAHGRGDAQIALGPLAKNAADARPAVLELRWSGTLAAAVYARIERAILAGEWAGARIFAGEVSKPAIIGDPTPWMAGADGAPLRLSPGGFAQASEIENAHLAARVAEIAATVRGPAGSARALELFAGAGNLSVLLARTAELVAVESDRGACDAARLNLAARGLSARVVEADAETHSIAQGTTLVVLDPPRTGARATATTLAARPPKHVIYVSCDPATLGRDLAILAPKYAPSSIETFEMFPGTSHVETVVHLTKLRP